MSYQIEGAVVKEQGVTFAIVVVKHNVSENSNENKKAINAYQHIFPGMPIILLGRDSQGKAAYHGPEEIVNFIAVVDPNRIPWRHYVIT